MRKKIIAATPILSTIIFLVLCFAKDFGFSDHSLAHPGWIVFLAIPLMPYILFMRSLRNAYSLIVTIVFLILCLSKQFGFFDHSLAHPGWIIFLTIPLFNILFKPKRSESRYRINIERRD